MKEPVLPFTEVFESLWAYTPGAPEEGLSTSKKVFKGQRVQLPHRVLQPDCPLWYERTIILTEPGVLTISADDGAQVYLQGKRIRRLHAEHFPVDTSGRVLLTIRVLNNAMAGGLRRVTFSTREQYHAYCQAMARHVRRKGLAEKIFLLQAPADSLVQQAERMLASDNAAMEATLNKYLSEFPLLTGPWLQRMDSAIQISVQAEDHRPVTLKYGLNPLLTNAVEITADSTAHFRLRDLLPDTTYYYSMAAGKTVSAVHDFHTGTSPQKFSFNVWADSQSGLEAFQKNVANLGPYHDAFGIGAGDLVNNGASEQEWLAFLNILSASAAEIPYYLVPGNHDYDSLRPAYYERYIHATPPHVFQWTFGNCVFITLDPNENFPVSVSPSSRQHAWFLQQLETPAWKQATWRFVLVHQPPLSQGWEGYHGEASMRDLLEPVLERAKIDFVIAGHTHDYERLTKSYGKQATTFLIVGGAGGSLEPGPSSTQPQMDTVVKVHHMGRFYVNGNALRFEALDLSGKVMDSFTQTK